MKHICLTILVILLMSLILSSCGSVSGLFAAPTNTPTLRPTFTPRPSATPNIAATQQYEDMFSRVQEYYDKGYLPSTKGKYIPLEDFENNWAQMRWYDFFATGYRAKDFVVKVDIEWSNAIRNPEPSGCGFCFRIQDNGDHYLVFLDTEMVVVGGLDRSSSRYLKPFGVTSGTGTVDFGNPATANFTLVVNGDHAYVLVDDKLIGKYTLYTEKLLDEGYLAYTITSGTNKDYGTRCKMTNAVLWTVSP